MGGRLQVLVLVVALASRPSMQMTSNWLSGVQDRCWDAFGEEAAVDTVNTLYQLTVCTRFEELYGEVVMTLETSGLKEAVGTVCRRKDELLACSDQAFGTIRRCLYEDEQQGLTIIQGRIKPSMDFLCEHDDEIVAILGSQDEMQCVKRLGERAKRCNPYGSISPDEILDYLKSLKKECKNLEGFLGCLNSIPGNCSESSALHLLNDMIREVVDGVVCPNRVQVSTSAPLPKSTDLLSVVARRCRNTAGDQAAADLLTILHHLSVCLRFHDLYGEFTTTKATSGLKAAIGSVCLRRDEMLTCSGRTFQTIKRCLYEDEQQGLNILQGIIKPSMDFLCRHDDEIVAMFGSQEEMQCVTTLGERAKRCNPYEVINSEEILDFLKSLKKECKNLERFMDCVNGVPGNCTESTTLRVFNKIIREVVDDAVCSNKVQLSTSRPPMQSTDLPPGVAGRCQGMDVLNIMNQFMVCSKLEELNDEMAKNKMTNGLKAAIGTACRQKDELLICSDQAFETMKGCLNQKEQDRLSILQRRIEPFMEFLCKNDDEIIAKDEWAM